MVPVTLLNNPPLKLRSFTQTASFLDDFGIRIIRETNFVTSGILAKVMKFVNIKICNVLLQ